MIRGGKAADSQEQPVKGLYRYALATALATFLLLILGGGVTSSDVGMADPQWPTPPWYLIWYFSVADSFQRGWGESVTFLGPWKASFVGGVRREEIQISGLH